MLILKTAFFTLFISAIAVAQIPQAAPAVPEHPGLNTIVDRVEQSALANRDHYRAYVLTREYLMYGAAAQERPASEVLAEITFVPPTTKEYKIVEARGSSRGQGVVRQILENESKATATGNAPGAVSRENYNFTYVGEDALEGHRCYILGLQPKHKDKDLVIGQAWVDEQTFLVRRIHGHMAKLPSWWLKAVDVTLDFSEAGGMWLQTRTKAVAEVRVFGTHVLTANAVKFQAADTVAQNVTPAKPSRPAAKHPQRTLGAVIPIQH